MLRTALRRSLTQNSSQEWLQPKASIVTRSWRRFVSMSRMKKMGVICLTPGVLFGSYVGTSMVVYHFHSPSVDDMFLERVVDGNDFSTDHFFVVEEWNRVKKTLQVGDVVLLMGTGSMSWKITNSQFVLSGMNPAALRYSHVGVVVKQYDNRSNTGPWCLEAVANTDINAPDINGTVRHDCVQVVDVSQRINGTQEGRPCYKRAAIRRLQGFSMTRQRRKMVEAFVEKNAGRPLDKSPLIMLTAVHPRLYDALGRRQPATAVTCSELIANLYDTIGVSRERQESLSVWTALCGKLMSAAGGSEDILFGGGRSHIVPCHFAEGMESPLGFVDGVCLGPEVRMEVAAYASLRKDI